MKLSFAVYLIIQKLRDLGKGLYQLDSYELLNSFLAWYILVRTTCIFGICVLKRFFFIHLDGLKIHLISNETCLLLEDSFPSFVKISNLNIPSTNFFKRYKDRLDRTQYIYILSSMDSFLLISLIFNVKKIKGKRF